MIMNYSKYMLNPTRLEDEPDEKDKDKDEKGPEQGLLAVLEVDRALERTALGTRPGGFLGELRPQRRHRGDLGSLGHGGRFERSIVVQAHDETDPVRLFSVEEYA